MEYQEFLCVIEKKMNQELKGGAAASLHTAVKNNGKVKQGVMIKTPGINISPTIYLEEFYQRFQKGETISEILNDLLTFYESVKCEKSWDTNAVERYEEVRDKIVFKVIHTKKNEELLETTPHIRLLDLSIVFYVLLEAKEEAVSSILIGREHLAVWKIKEAELFPLACENLKTLLPAQMLSMQSVIRELFYSGEKTAENLLNGSEILTQDFMYVITNPIRCFGAACIAYPGLLDKIAGLLKESYYILPSSIHEVILVPESRGILQNELNKMIVDVNTVQVKEEERLGDHAYFYNKDTKQLV